MCAPGLRGGRMGEYAWLGEAPPIWQGVVLYADKCSRNGPCLQSSVLQLSLQKHAINKLYVCVRAYRHHRRTRVNNVGVAADFVAQAKGFNHDERD